MVVYGAALLATAAAGILARARRASGIVRKNYGGFQPVVCDSHEYANDVGYLPDGTPINQAGNNSLRAPAPPYSATATPPPAVAPPPAAAAPPVVAPPPVVGSFTTTADALHGIKFGYSMQKDAYADLEYLNDVGGLIQILLCKIGLELHGNLHISIVTLEHSVQLFKASACLQ